MAMMNTGGSGSRAYSYSSYTVTETYSLEEAVQKASQGSLSPGEVYRQMSGPLQAMVDQISSRKFSGSFSGFTLTQQREVMGELSSEIKRAKEQSEKPLSLADALQLAVEGKIDDIKLYNALPDELRQGMNALAAGLHASSFTVASPESRRQILKNVLILCQGSAAARVDEGLELHNRALQLKSEGDATGALTKMREAEKILSAQARAATEPSVASITVYCNWSSALAMLGDWTSDAAVLQATIEGADRGLAMVRKLTHPSRFEEGVLLHNRGHAGWRLGEVTRKPVTLTRAIDDIAKAGEVFTSLQRRDAIAENSDLLAKAKSALTSSAHPLPIEGSNGMFRGLLQRLRRKDHA
jgi:hypothetical protein